MKFFVALFAVLLMSPVSGFAAGKNAWTQCGIGGLIFQKTGWAAAISNIIWDLGTTATTSSSSSPSQCSGSASVGKMIYENYARVEEETAAGQGEHLVAVMEMLKCDRSMHSAIISDVRHDFLKDVQDKSYSQKSNLEKTEVLFNNVMNKTNGKYSEFCSAS